MRLVVLLLAVGAVASGAASQPAVPDLTGRVVDLADLLSPEAERAIAELSRAHEDSTTNQVAVLTVPSLNGENLEEWATEVFRTWGLGQAEANNGVLLLIARDDRKIRIEVGYGLEGDLTDARAGRIIRNEMTPRFRDRAFEAGTLAAVEAIVGTLDGSYDPPLGPGFGIGWFWVIVLVVSLGAMLYVSKDGFEEATAVFEYGCAGWFFAVPLVIVLIRTTGNWWFLFILIGLPAVLYGVHAVLDRHPTLGPRRREKRRIWRIIHEAQKEGKTSVEIDGVTHTVPAKPAPTRSTGSASSSGSSWSSSFSGGGGSSGGGGASGGW